MLDILQLNVELNLHTDKIIAHVQAQNYDVLLLQEVLQDELDTIAQACNMQYAFAPLNTIEHQGILQILGLATFSKHPLCNIEQLYYRGDPKNLPLITRQTPELMARALLVVEVPANGQTYRLINTHFTWSQNATVNAMQRQDFDKMLTMLQQYDQFLLGGDFNTPRGRELYDHLAHIYTDNIPLDIKSTLDKEFFRVPGLELVIDGVFTTAKYKVAGMQILQGLSDHVGIAFQL